MYSDLEDGSCPMAPTDGTAPEACTLEIIVTEEMQQPIFVYYQLTNFYQNHRRYVKSRDYKQLMGYEEGDDAWVPQTKEDVSSSCDPIITNENLANMGIKYYAWNSEGTWGYAENTPLVADDIAVPCGLIAKSMFNDTYAFYSDADLTTPIDINQNGIAWKSDVEYKFGNSKDWMETPT